MTFIGTLKIGPVTLNRGDIFIWKSFRELHVLIRRYQIIVSIL